MNDERGIVIERVFDAPSKAVWRAWTDPEVLKQWWGPEEFTAPDIKVDLKVGGKYIFAMHGPKGSEWDKDMYSAGIYLEIVPDEKLVVTDYFSDENGEMMEPADYGMDKDFPKESVVTVLFEETQAGRTKLSIIYPETARKEQMGAMLKSGMNEGWNSSLDKLAGVLSATSVKGAGRNVG
ncbi:MAG: SRPBCC family protein [Smithellaceae bacterium]